MDCAEIVRAYEASDSKNVTSLMLGSPGPETLKDCKDILTKATQTLLVSKSALLLEGDLCSMHSVQFSSRRYLCAWKSPYMRSTLSLRCFPNRLPLKQPQCRLIGWPSHPFKEDRFLFPRISPPGDRWCSVLGSATLKATCEGCFARQSICSVSHFPSLWYVQGSTPTLVFKGGCQPLTHANQDFPFHFSLFFSFFFFYRTELIESVRRMACVV